ncbi:UPF0481 protein At3g47200-like [Tasmannia lanceolata]|uniref:UPF0481 protein At3g47200-like n=1 Tax=Tasmannia lanceolata TaxID=3420 RepID=UPI004063067F
MGESSWAIDLEKQITTAEVDEEEIKRWVIDLEKNMEEEEMKTSRSIFKVPTQTTLLHKNAYEPNIVSFGPYHYGKSHLQLMETHKKKAVDYFLKNYGKPLNNYVKALEEVDQELRDSYENLDDEWKHREKFLKLMMFDGCFMLKILYEYKETLAKPGSENHDHFNFDPQLCLYIRRDMLMIENQLPLLGLVTLAAVQTGKSTVLFVLSFCYFLKLESNSKNSPYSNYINSTVFAEHTGVLNLPILIMDEITEISFLNLMAFERKAKGMGSAVSSFLAFMGSLINSEEDARFLRSKGIIQSTLGNDKAIVDCIKLLGKDMYFNPHSEMCLTQYRLNQYYLNSIKSWNKRLRDWSSNFMQTYVKNPWTLISLMVAGFVLSLTVTQTYYSIHKPK